MSMNMDIKHEQDKTSQKQNILAAKPPALNPAAARSLNPIFPLLPNLAIKVSKNPSRAVVYTAWRSRPALSPV